MHPLCVKSWTKCGAVCKGPRRQHLLLRKDIFDCRLRPAVPQYLVFRCPRDDHRQLSPPFPSFFLRASQFPVRLPSTFSGLNAQIPDGTYRCRACCWVYRSAIKPFPKTVHHNPVHHNFYYYALTIPQKSATINLRTRPFFQCADRLRFAHFCFLEVLWNEQI